TVAINRVASDTSVSTPTTGQAATVTQEDLSATGAGNLVLVTGGALTLNAGSAATNVISSASGNVLLSVTGTLDLNAALNAGSGHVSLVSSGAMRLAAAGDISTSAGTVELDATGGSLTMADGSVIQTGGGTGNIRLHASGDITVGLLDARVASDRTGATLSSQATWGAVSIASDASILDNAQTSVDIYASELRLNASATAGGVGTGANHLEVEVSKVSAQVGTGGLYLTESSAITVGQTAAITVNRVKTDGTVTGSTQTDAQQSDLISTGNLVLRTMAGAITVDEGDTDTGTLGIQASGNLLLQAGGATGDITLNARVISTGGHITLGADQNIVQNAHITASGAGTVDLRAGAAISMVDGVITSSTSGNIRYVATTTLTLGALSTSGNISLSASSISDSGTTETDLTANELRINTTGVASGNGAGTSTNHLELNVAKLAASVAGTGTGGLFLTEANAIQIGTLSAINVNQVGTDGATLTATVDTAQSNLSSAAHLILITTAGSIATLSSGGATSAAGNLLMSAGGTSSDITLGATVTNSVGHTSLSAGASIVQNANITASGAASTIELIAGS
ncbi:MAG: hypothetical protein Q8R13_00840, partial [bacterium]|nr:hypothetical protein [bacterium]